MSEKLVKKCELGEFNFDNDLVTNCSAVLENVEKHAEALNVSKEQTKSYLEMAQNLKPKDVSEVLKLALKIRESGDVKDTEAKNDASRLIRTIEAS
ncbi:hypothetical protein [Methanobrevibacter curvatus]|uniref:Uncharacterized protein n=1 Tax=Methanobrevibacter curvatus TaxID=49547 RepID=A0A166C522_9EURY|nr:hypothetical protein [Methanobrevibacter curvatus]KZX14134.1 hypothetical protein MBCUR_06100 [Methanobrevibacter curvatus]